MEQIKAKTIKELENFFATMNWHEMYRGYHLAGYSVSSWVDEEEVFVTLILKDEAGHHKVFRLTHQVDIDIIEDVINRNCSVAIKHGVRSYRKHMKGESF